MEKENWHTDHLPDGYPKQCDTEQLKNVIQDLNDEYYRKTRSGKNNVIWERLISNLIKSGRDELGQREQSNKKENASWFSMSNPLVYIVVILLLAGITYLAYKFGLPLRFGSN